MSNQVTDGFELADTLPTFHTAFSLFKVEHDPKLQIIQAQDHLALLHFELDLVVTIEVEFHEDLLDESFIRDSVSELDHLSVVFLAVQQFVE